MRRRGRVRGVVLVAGLLLVSAVVRVPMRFDASGVEKLHLTGGSLRLERGGEAELNAWVPIYCMPFVMVRQTVRAQFLKPGQFVWHCHIVEYEDNEMMRPVRIGPKQPGQPMPMPHGGGGGMGGM